MGWVMGRQKSKQDVSRVGGTIGWEVAVDTHLPEHGLGLLQVKASGCNKSMVRVGYQTACLRLGPSPPVASPSQLSALAQNLPRGLVKQHSPELVDLTGQVQGSWEWGQSIWADNQVKGRRK